MKKVKVLYEEDCAEIATGSINFFESERKK